MEYQIYKKENNELVAWIDTEDDRVVTHHDYDVRCGVNLKVAEMEDELKLKVKIIKHDDVDVYPNSHFKSALSDNKSDWIDLIAAESVYMCKGSTKIIPLGVAIELPKGYEALLIPRSSTAKNFHIIQANSVGLIDESYCGDNDEWGFFAYAIDNVLIRAGTRICQFRLFKHQPEVNIEVVQSLNNENRGGFGSTGL